MYGARVSRALHSPPYTRLRDLLAAARRKARLTQQEVADRMDRPQSFVSKYESGERTLDVIEFIEVCTALGASPVGVVRQLSHHPE